MAICKVWIHFVWTTNRRKPVLSETIRPMLFNHITLNSESKKINLDCVNGYNDHVHALVNLRSTQSISRVIQLIKGESAHWANENCLLQEEKLVWQDDYIAASVSISELELVRQQILNQEEIHRKISFTQECREILGFLS
jgi:putative transposase